MSFKSKGIYFGWEGEHARKDVRQRGVEETAKALMQNRGLPPWAQQVTGHWGPC